MNILMVIILLTFCDVAIGMYLMLMITENEKKEKHGEEINFEGRALR